jgi:hypothetical protein
VLPLCNSKAMNLHLAEIAKDVAPGRHAILLLDQAGWHTVARQSGWEKPPKLSRHSEPNFFARAQVSLAC